jgi:hypothetical protein
MSEDWIDQLDLSFLDDPEEMVSVKVSAIEKAIEANYIAIAVGLFIVEMGKLPYWQRVLIALVLGEKTNNKLSDVITRMQSVK